MPWDITIFTLGTRVGPQRRLLIGSEFKVLLRSSLEGKKDLTSSGLFCKEARKGLLLQVETVSAFLATYSCRWGHDSSSVSLACSMAQSGNPGATSVWGSAGGIRGLSPATLSLAQSSVSPWQLRPWNWFARCKAQLLSLSRRRRRRSSCP